MSYTCLLRVILLNLKEDFGIKKTRLYFKSRFLIFINPYLLTASFKVFPALNTGALDAGI